MFSYLSFPRKRESFVFFEIEDAAARGTGPEKEEAWTARDTKVKVALAGSVLFLALLVPGQRAGRIGNDYAFTQYPTGRVEVEQYEVVSWDLKGAGYETRPVKTFTCVKKGKELEVESIAVSTAIQTKTKIERSPNFPLGFRIWIKRVYPDPAISTRPTVADVAFTAADSLVNNLAGRATNTAPVSTNRNGGIRWGRAQTLHPGDTK